MKVGIGAVAVSACGLAGLVVPEACAHRQPSPSDVVRDFALAVQHGNYDQAYSLMSDDYRRQVPLSRFRGEIEAERPIAVGDAAVVVEGLTRTSGGPVRAQVDTPTGDHVPLIMQGGAWKLSLQPLVPFGQQSPRAALRTFVRALEQRRYDVVLRLLPARHRSRVTEAKLRLYWEGPDSARNRHLLEQLRGNLDAPIIEFGLDAQMPYGKPGQEGEVHFILEEGVWKVDDAN